MDYLTLNESEAAALVAAIDDSDVVSVQLSRRDSLDQPYDQGFLVVSVVMRDGRQWRDAVSETGSTSLWSSAPARLDTVSSASRQHFIDTGRYLAIGEADES